MKKYVILGYIYGIGGWQTYIANKLKLMETQGWEVYAISNGYNAMKSAQLPSLEKYSGNRIYALSFEYPSELSSKNRIIVVEQIKSIINYNEEDEVIFEATTLDLFMWTEFLARQCNGRSLCVEVSNRFKKYNKNVLEFFLFKEKRGELMMMSKTGLYELFEGYAQYPKIDTNNVGALTQEEYTDDGNDYKTQLQLTKADYVIGTLGWLNKGYYSILIDEIITFATNHEDKEIHFIVIGNSRNGDVEKDYINKAFSITNLHLHMMGAIAPVPSNLIRLFDVAVASYGCATITDKLGVKTIVMHDPENIPLGILSYTKIKPPIQERVNFDKTINDMLEDILINNICNSMTYSPYQSVSISEQKLKHLKRLDQMDKTISYYDVISVKNVSASHGHKIKCLFQKIFGLNVTEVVFNKIKPI